MRRVIGIDWSGARGPRLPGLQVAVCEAGETPPTLIRRAWTREGVAAYVSEAVAAGALVGIDCSFAYPWGDQRAYFPGMADSPADAPALWARIERLCSGAADLYGGPCYRHAEAPLAPWLLYQTYRGAHYAPRLRATEAAAGALGARPTPTGKCVGPDAVGSGSLAGMRLLHRLHAGGIPIWPVTATAGPCVVEIFPRLFCRQAVGRSRAWGDAATWRRAFAHYASQPPPPPATEDEADALLTAAALRHLAHEDACWHPPALTDEIRQHEGWIFGVH